MDPAAPPPWRVFDAPAPDSARAAEPPSNRARPAASEPGIAGLIANPRLLAIAGLLGVAGLALAALVAVAGLDGGVAIDGGVGLGSPEPRGSGTGGGELVVDVAGAVLRPGVYHLPAGARVGDAIAAAGGYSPRVAAELASTQLNLAALVHDGDRVAVPSRDEQAGGPGSSPGSGGSGGGGGGSHLIDLNHASPDELDTLPGIGPVTVAKILAARADSPFTSVDQLLERKLVGQKVFDQLKSLVTV